MPTALALLAHPDDIEILCAGTLHRLQSECGWSIHLATMTPGDCGSTDLPPEQIAAIRRGEAAAAAATLGGPFACLEERDLRIVYSEATVEKAVRLINAVRPEMIFTHSPSDYHLDHEETNRIVRAAAFAAPIPNFLATHDHPPLDSLPHLYYCDPLEGKDSLGRPVPFEFLIDISSVIDVKAAALSCHESQRAWLRKHHGVDNLVESMKEWSARQGRQCGVAFAEGFRQHLGHSFPQTNRLLELLRSSDS